MKVEEHRVTSMYDACANARSAHDRSREKLTAKQRRASILAARELITWMEARHRRLLHRGTSLQRIRHTGAPWELRQLHTFAESFAGKKDAKDLIGLLMDNWEEVVYRLADNPVVSGIHKTYFDWGLIVSQPSLFEQQAALLGSKKRNPVKLSRALRGL